MTEDRICLGTPPLPQELVDHIIDLVAASDDRAALGACALTARGWTHRARTHLHHTLTLRHRTYYVHPRTRVASAKRALDPAVRGALPYVRVLHVRGESSNLCFHADADACDSKESGAVFWEVLGAVMDAAAERVDAERGRSGVGLCLKVSDLYCGDARPEDTERLCAALRIAGRVEAIAQVEMVDCEFRCPGELRRVLKACGRLDTLRLDWIFWAQDTADSWGARIYNRSRGRLPPSAVATRETGGKEEELAVDFGGLAHLQVGHCSGEMDENIIKMFMPAQEPSYVRQLSLGPTDLDIETLPVWVRAVGPSVEHLRLSFGQISQPEVVKQVVGCLQHCSKLQKITLSATPWGSSAAPCNPHFWACALEVLLVVLAQAQDLEAIEFVCPSGDMKIEGKEQSEKEEMDRLFARLRAKDAYGPKLAVTFVQSVDGS